MTTPQHSSLHTAADVRFMDADVRLLDMLLAGMDCASVVTAAPASFTIDRAHMTVRQTRTALQAAIGQSAPRLLASATAQILEVTAVRLARSLPATAHARETAAACTDLAQRLRAVTIRAVRAQDERSGADVPAVDSGATVAQRAA